MKRGGRLARRTRLKNRGRSRFPQVRDPAYCAWVCSLGCLLHRADCWRQIHPAHVGRTRAQGTGDRGEVVNLCARHHPEQEGQTAAFERKYGLPEGHLQDHALRLAALYEGRDTEAWA